MPELTPLPPPDGSEAPVPPQPDTFGWTFLPGAWRVLGYLVEDRNRLDNTVRLLRAVAVSLVVVLAVVAVILWLMPAAQSARAWASATGGIVAVGAGSAWVRRRRRRRRGQARRRKS